MARFRSKTIDPPERIDPSTELPGIVAHHITKYEFARASTGGALWLDVGCGVGYGTAHLSSEDRLVVGVDADESALAVGRTKYLADRVRFLQMDATKLAFRSGSFDTVVCFEVIEHLPDPAAHVEEARRVLCPSGAYVVSTPRAGMGGDPATNPFHQREFSSGELGDLLRESFSDVVMLGQRRLRGSSEALLRKADPLGLRRLTWVRPIVRALAPTLKVRPTEDAILSDFVIDEEGRDSGTELVAVCRGPLPSRSTSGG